LLHEAIARVARTSANILITGESGTGKELVACKIHQDSGRTGRMVALNCAAIPENLLESELFGYEKGAFTGAEQARAGLFEEASNGTLLLDEIGDMPLSLQSKILRVIQEREVRRVGGNQSIPVDVRLLASTHRDLHDAQRAGTFRQDLLYRLEVISIHIPALRDRIEDVVELATHFIRLHGERHHKAGLHLEPGALQALLAHSWPGNVRELSNVIERAVIFSSTGFITVAELPAHLQNPDLSIVMGSSAIQPGEEGFFVRAGTPLRDVEDQHIRKTLEANAGDKERAARQLGIHSRTILRKLDGTAKRGS
ncbi:MAG: sigma 54-interacting transcriptional regulator, partial [Bdellovibrionota bacterium]